MKDSLVFFAAFVGGLSSLAALAGLLESGVLAQVVFWRRDWSLTRRRQRAIEDATRLLMFLDLSSRLDSQIRPAGLGEVQEAAQRRLGSLVLDLNETLVSVRPRSPRGIRPQQLSLPVRIPSFSASLRVRVGWPTFGRMKAMARWLLLLRRPYGRAATISQIVYYVSLLGFVLSTSAIPQDPETDQYTLREAYESLTGFYLLVPLFFLVATAVFRRLAVRRGSRSSGDRVPIPDEGVSESTVSA